MTLWQYPLRGRQVFVGSGALVPARKKICRVLVALKTVTMQQICLNIFIRLLNVVRLHPHPHPQDKQVAQIWRFLASNEPFWLVITVATIWSATSLEFWRYFKIQGLNAANFPKALGFRTLSTRCPSTQSYTPSLTLFAQLQNKGPRQL